MPIPQASLTSNLSALAASVDSSSEALSILQIANKAMEYGDYKKYYDSAGQLPLADSAIEGSIAVVNTTQGETYSGTLYGCNGADWNVIKFLDPSPRPLYFLGQNYGYSMSTAGNINVDPTEIESFPFASVTASVHGQDIYKSYYNTGGISDTLNKDGYVVGGRQLEIPPTGYLDDVRKFSMTSASNASLFSELGTPTVFSSNSSDVVNSSGYCFAGRDVPGPSYPVAISKIPFVSGAPVSTHGNMTFGRSTAYGFTDKDGSKGFCAGGYIGPSASYNNISSFPFVSNSGATDVATLTATYSRGAAVSSSTDGYTCGGYLIPLFPGPTWIHSTVNKFSFSSTTPATDIGNFETAPINRIIVGGGISSETNAYVSGGQTRAATGPTSVATSDIRSFPFASGSGVSSSVGSLTASNLGYATGHQY